MRVGNHRGWPGLTLVFDDVAVIVLSSRFPTRDCHCDEAEKLKVEAHESGPFYMI